MPTYTRHTRPDMVVRGTLPDHRSHTVGETPVPERDMVSGAGALGHGAPAGGGRKSPSRRSWIPELCSLALGLALCSNPSLGAQADPSVKTDAASERLVLEATLDLKGLDLNAIASGQFRPRTLLSADISKVPLRKALKFLSRQTGIKVFVAAAVPDEDLYIKFDGLSLDEAVKRLLVGKNYLLTYGKPVVLEHHTGEAPTKKDNGSHLAANSADQSQPETDANLPADRQIAEIRILSQGSATIGASEGMVEIKEEPDERAREIEALVVKAHKGTRPEDRVAALEAFRALAGDEEIPAILPTLKDEDESVRRAGLETLENLSSGTPPVDELAELAHRDPSPNLRIQALEVLVEFLPGRSETYIQEALKDPDLKVREHAQRMLGIDAKLTEYAAQAAAQRDLE